MPDSHRPDEVARQLPDAAPASPGTDLAAIHQAAAAPALAIWFNEALFNKAKLIATYIAGAEGFTPRHLIGRHQACFAVVERALTWRLSPFAVAQSTFQIPGSDRVGYEGKLVQAILENSGQIEGGVQYEHYGSVAVKFKNGRQRLLHTNDPALEQALADPENKAIAEYGWDAVQGKYEIKKSQKGNEYAAATWTNEDAKGLGVTVIAKVKGETEPRRLDFDLVQAFPRNSTLWATDPMTQVKYTAVRRFASVAAPGIFMGVPFDQEDVIDPGIAARDVTPPRPERPFDPTFPATGQPMPPAAKSEDGAPADTQAARDAQPYEIVDVDGEMHQETDVGKALELFRLCIEQGAKRGDQALEGFWESNGVFLSQLRERDYAGQADQVGKEYGEALAALDHARRAAKEAHPEPKADTKTEPKKRTAKEKAAGAPPAPPPGGAPVSPLNGGGEWPTYLPWFAEQIRTVPLAELDDFLNLYDAEIAFIRKWRPGDKEMIEAIIEGRRTE